MKNLLKAVTTAAAAGALLISVSATADDHSRAEKRLDRMAEHLEMDAEQKEMMKAIRDEFQPQLKALRQESREVRQALREAMQSGDDVGALATRQGDLMEQMILLRADMKRRTSELLTEEQLEKLQSAREHRKKRGKKHRRGHHKDREMHPEGEGHEGEEV